MTEARNTAAVLSLRLTLLGLLLHPVGPLPLRVSILLLVSAGLVFPDVLRRSGLWMSLAVLTALRPVLDWPLADNHAYLLSYWCLGVALTVAHAAGDEPLRQTARALVGLVFAFAFLWKGVLSPDFLSGDFMQFAWVTDPRLTDAARWLGGLGGDAREANLAFLAGAPGAPDALVGGDRLFLAARLAAGWTLALEGAVALGFLLRGPRVLRSIGHAALLLFAATTYAFVTVEGFAWLLLSMGMVATEDKWFRFGYLAVYALVLVFAYLL